MPKLTVEGYRTVEVASGKRLVRAIEEDARVDILHACGGNARCTTCRIEFIAGEPDRMTEAERSVLGPRPRVVAQMHAAEQRQLDEPRGLAADLPDERHRLAARRGQEHLHPRPEAGDGVGERALRERALHEPRSTIHAIPR